MCVRRQANGRRTDRRPRSERLERRLRLPGFWLWTSKLKFLDCVAALPGVYSKGRHKSSGLSATTINRMLAAPSLPPSVRAILLEYIEEKTAGVYGDCKKRRSQFAARLAQGIPKSLRPPSRQQIGSSRRMRAPSPRASLTVLWLSGTRGGTHVSRRSTWPGSRQAD